MTGKEKCKSTSKIAMYGNGDKYVPSNGSFRKFVTALNKIMHHNWRVQTVTLY